MKSQAIIGSTIIDGTGSATLRNGTILINDGKIAEVGKADQIKLGPDVDQIDATGKFTMPGIIESHVHVTPNQDGPEDDSNKLQV